MLINHLIKLYSHVCHKYNEQLCWEVQRFSNNPPSANAITDEELITIYLFCVAYEETYKLKAIHRHIKNHWLSWFPTLPSYQAFNARLNRLCDAFPVLLADFFQDASLCCEGVKVLLGDSFPVVTCSHKRGGTVARELTDKGFCATKKLHFYGVKVHAFGWRRPATLPFPQSFAITPASVHDLTASRHLLENLPADVSVLDKAYADRELARQMRANHNLLLTPLKNKTGWEAALQQSDRAFHDLYNKAVATLRQPIESLFNWINEKTQSKTPLKSARQTAFACTSLESSRPP